MSIPVLLFSTATRWMGTARVPSALSKAGFVVSLLTPRNALAERSRFVSWISYLPDDATVAQSIAALAGAARATLPRLVLPCDDMAFRLLSMLALARPPEMQPSQHAALASLVRDSLGNPAFYERSVDKTRLPAAAESLGVRVPPHAVVTTAAAAEAFAAVHRYPVVLKRAHGFAGRGVAICADRHDVVQAFVQFSRPDALDLGHLGPVPVLVQARVPGLVQYYLATAWNGNLVAGIGAEKVIANPEPTGPPTVTRYFRAPHLRAAAASIVAGFGMSGHFFVEFIVPADGGEPMLLEVNRRITPGSHRTRLVDQWSALHAVLTGDAAPSRTELDVGEEGLSIWFPEEWLRDPGSRYLREYPVDLPWEEPELIEAMLAMRHER